MLLPNVSSKYGAPMGRRSDDLAQDLENEDVPRGSVRLVRVTMSSDGAYDNGGAYWGHGTPLYCARWTCISEAGEHDAAGNVPRFRYAFTRAATRAKAAELFGVGNLHLVKPV